jgi:hypothetical protein
MVHCRPPDDAFFLSPPSPLLPLVFFLSVLDKERFTPDDFFEGVPFRADFLYRFDIFGLDTVVAFSSCWLGTTARGVRGFVGGTLPTRSVRNVDDGASLGGIARNAAMLDVGVLFACCSNNIGRTTKPYTLQ